MSPWNAARLGDHLSAIDTPALILDRDAFEHALFVRTTVMSRPTAARGALL